MRKQSTVYKVPSGCELRADVYRPPDDLLRPAILWLHGGALIVGSRATIDPAQVQRYVAAGYAVVAPDYRLLPEAKLDAIIDDLRDAYAWLRASSAELRIDPERIAIVGHSAGGYLTLMAGCTCQPAPQALVSFYGYGDIVARWYSQPDPFYSQLTPLSRAEAYAGVGRDVVSGTPFEGSLFEARFRFYLYCRQQGLWPLEATGHDPQTEPRWFDPYCPLRNVTPAYPPTLLIHGDQDTDVPVEQSDQMAAELTRQGVEHELIRLSGRGHAFDSDGAGMGDPVVAGVFDRVLHFLARTLAA